MPEKPEVITVKNTLKKHLLGKTITNCRVYWDNIISYPSKDEFIERVLNQTIHDIQTRGKFLLFLLDQDVLLIHLRMEGKFLFRTEKDPIEKHEHVDFVLDKDISFRFHDVRKFGKMYLIDKDKVFTSKPLSDLGYEYDDSNLTKQYLHNRFKNKNIPIKSALLDQSIIAGIGNIYADEILFLSQVSPFRESCKLSLRECHLLIHSCRCVMEKAISLGGTTIKSFTSSEGVHGLFQNELLVHGKEKDPCPYCSTPILKVKIGGRGTYYCKKCQK